MTDHRDVIAAFADQEPVDAEALSAALADPDAREYFIDILLLRGLVGTDAPRNQKERGTGNLKPRNRAIAAAALVTIGLGAGFLAARATLNRNGDAVVRPDAMTASPAPGTGSTGAATQAPAPTHVIRLENGVDWNEKSGGK